MVDGISVVHVFHHADGAAGGICNQGEPAAKRHAVRSHHDFPAKPWHPGEGLIEIRDTDNAQPAGFGIFAIREDGHATAIERAIREQQFVLLSRAGVRPTS